VGKTAITIRFMHDKFLKKYDPTIEDTYQKTVDIEDEPRVLQILDTAGAEQFTSSKDLYIKDSNGFILVYSITTKSTLVDIEQIYKRMLKVKEKQIVPTVLVGNKCDMEDVRQITLEEGKEIAEKINAPFFESSALVPINIEEVFVSIVHRIDDVDPVGTRRRVTCSLL